MGEGFVHTEQNFQTELTHSDSSGTFGEKIKRKFLIFSKSSGHKIQFHLIKF